VSKTKEIRCSQLRQKRGGKERVCDRFIALIEENTVRVKCPCCGTNYILVPQAERGPEAIRLVGELRNSKPKE